jgi:transposase
LENENPEKQKVVQMYIWHGEVYKDKADVKRIKNEPGYVKKRYHAMVKTLAKGSLRIKRKEAARMIGRSLRQLYRILKRFKQEGILGLRHRSKRPKTSPNKISDDLEKQIIQVRKETGFGSDHIVVLLNESFRRQGKKLRLYGSLVYHVLVRNKVIEQERRKKKNWKFFEWGHPRHLIQVDLTKFNGVYILTMLDDYSRKGWSLSLKNGEDDTVITGMKTLLFEKFENLLTDNGSQFSRKNKAMRKYCEEWVKDKHIWASVHHPQTLGKLGAYQKGLKRFLFHKLQRSRARTQINQYIGIYDHWYNNGKYHAAIGSYPEERYSGNRDDQWYECFVKELKLQDVLTI